MGRPRRRRRAFQNVFHDLPAHTHTLTLTHTLSLTHTRLNRRDGRLTEPWRCCLACLLASS